MRHTSSWLVLLLTVLVTSGCKEIVYQDRIVNVHVPVFEQPPAPAKIDLPRLPIYDLTEESTPDEVAKAFVSSAEILLSHSKQKDESTKPFEEKPGG